MFSLTRDERLIIIFLSLIALLGVGVNRYQKIRYQGDLEIGSSEATRLNSIIDKPALKTELVDINNASVEELMRLPGIGAVIAQRIIDYRLTYGPFKKIEDITAVKGIGAAKFSRIKEFLIAQ